MLEEVGETRLISGVVARAYTDVHSRRSTPRVAVSNQHNIEAVPQSEPTILATVTSRFEDALSGGGFVRRVRTCGERHGLGVGRADESVCVPIQITCIDSNVGRR